MPTVLRWKGYRFFCYYGDQLEPPHVHIVKDGCECKIWLRDMSVVFHHGYSSPDLKAVVVRTGEERDRFLEVWNEHFSR